MNEKQKQLLAIAHNIINFGCFAVGEVLIWHATHSWWIIFYAFIAALHFDLKQIADK